MPGRLLSLLVERPRLIVSLPENSPALARAAAEGGADALKVHLHITHQASGTRFGSLAEERANLAEILSLRLPTGVVPGAGDCLTTYEELCELARMGMDFFDLFLRDMPAWMLTFSGMTRAAAVDQSTDLDSLREWEAVGIEMIEAAIVPREGYGKALRVSDVVAYRRIRRATKLPIIVPTERAIAPEDVPLLVQQAGVNAIMIGAVVTGREPETLGAAAQRFARALAGARG
jgi:hypothetical protein